MFLQEGKLRKKQTRSQKREERYEHAREKTKESVVSHIIGMRERMQAVSELVRENAEKQRARQKRWYDGTAGQWELSPEDKVLVLLPATGGELLAQWRGPYEIVRRIGKMDYEVQISKRKIFHINLLREWQEGKEVADYYCDEKTEDGKENGLCKDDVDELADWNTGWESSPLTVGNALSEWQGEQLQNLCEQLGEVLSGKPGHTGIAEHGVVTGSCRPVRQPPCQIPYAYHSEVDMETQGMLAEGVVEPSGSDWASPVVIVRERDSTLRLCVDYGKLIAETEIDAYPMPRMDDVLDQMGQAGCFYIFGPCKRILAGLCGGGDCYGTAFVGSFGLCRFEVPPIDLSGATAAFQRLVNHIAGGLRGFAHAYLDGLVVFCATWEDHLEQLAMVLGRLQEAGLTVKPSKCQFAVKE
uniref:Uncharacterized protein n=1 Tax=Amphimedon queenslandica TaxID=400682 RepID=A0A1X7VT01_AMPQE